MFELIGAILEKVLWKRWQVGASGGGPAEWAGAAGEGIRGGAVEIFYLTLWFSTPCTPIGGGGFNRFAHSARPGIVEQRGIFYFSCWSAF